MIIFGIFENSKKSEQIFLIEINKLKFVLLLVEEEEEAYSTVSSVDAVVRLAIKVS